MTSTTISDRLYCLGLPREVYRSYSSSRSTKRIASYCRHPLRAQNSVKQMCPTTETYDYRAQSGGWTPPSRNVFGSPYTHYPTLTIDYSTNDIYAFATVVGEIMLKTKTLAQ